MSEHEDMPEDRYDRFAAMDRTSIVMNMVGEYCLEDRVIKARPRLLDLASRAHDALYELYQACAEVSFEDKD